MPPAVSTDAPARSNPDWLNNALAICSASALDGNPGTVVGGGQVGGGATGGVVGREADGLPGPVAGVVMAGPPALPATPVDPDPFGVSVPAGTATAQPDDPLAAPLAAPSNDQNSPFP